MNADCFLDTNVLVYAAAGGTDPRRQQALTLVETQDFGLSAQVLQEFYVTVTRKVAVPLPPHAALEWIEQWEAFPVAPVDASLVKVAAELSERYRISYWDGAILAAALDLGATTLYSEDLNDGQAYEGLVVRNPFER
jgi:predicted nucleic acid-binding protein